MTAIIYKPTKTTMQFGKKGTKKWILEFAQEECSTFTEPVMGWQSSCDMQYNQVRLNFDTKKDAIEYAKRNNIEYSIVEPNIKLKQIRAYINNFKDNV